MLGAKSRGVLETREEGGGKRDGIGAWGGLRRKLSGDRRYPTSSGFGRIGFDERDVDFAADGASLLR